MKVHKLHGQRTHNLIAFENFFHLNCFKVVWKGRRIEMEIGIGIDCDQTKFEEYNNLVAYLAWLLNLSSSDYSDTSDTSDTSDKFIRNLYLF